jgi:hypothetical protein
MKLGNTSQSPALEAARAALFDGIVEDAGLEQVMGWSGRGQRTADIERPAFKKAWVELEPLAREGAASTVREGIDGSGTS